MSKFKVGDWVRIAVYRGFSTANDHLGKEGTITLIYPNGNCDIKVEGGVRCGPTKDLEPIPTESPGENGSWGFGGDREKSQPGPTPKTYTLTPYIKPETVTIKGVEYIMTENV